MDQESMAEGLRSNAIMSDAIKKASKANPKAFMVFANLDSDSTFVAGQGNDKDLLQMFANAIVQDEQITDYIKKALIVKTIHDITGGENDEQE